MPVAKICPSILSSDFAKLADECKRMVDAGADYLHVDVMDGLIEKVKACKMRVGIAIKPKTPADAIFPYLDMIDMALVMTVEPGFGGQSFMKDCCDKVAIIRKKNPSIDIQVDGGLAEDTVGFAAKAGANVIVAGTAIFGSPDPTKTISELRRSVETFVV